MLMNAMLTIGFVGVGVMGEPMCRHLATKSGASVMACDRDTAPLERLAAFGVQAASLDEIVQSADVIFMSLPSGAVAEARAIAVRVGMDPQKLFEAFAAGSADSFALRNQGMKAVAPQVFPEKAFPVTYARKDLSYAVALGDQVGVDVTGAKNLVACFDQAIASGWGEKYAPAISLVFEGAQPGS